MIYISSDGCVCVFNVIILTAFFCGFHSHIVIVPPSHKAIINLRSPRKSRTQTNTGSYTYARACTRTYKHTSGNRGDYPLKQMDSLGQIYLLTATLLHESS